MKANTLIPQNSERRNGEASGGIPTFYTSQEVGTMLKASQAKLCLLRKSGDLPAKFNKKIGKYLYEEKTIQRFLKESFV